MHTYLNEHSNQKKTSTAQEHFLPIPSNLYFNFGKMFRNVHTMVATAQLIFRIACKILSFNVCICIYAYISWRFGKATMKMKKFCTVIHSCGMEWVEPNKMKWTASFAFACAWTEHFTDYRDILNTVARIIFICKIYCLLRLILLIKFQVYI